MAVIDKASQERAVATAGGGGGGASTNRNGFPYQQTVMLCLCALAVFAMSQMELSSNRMASTGTYFVSDTKRIKQISIIGERNSGTRWTLG